MRVYLSGPMSGIAEHNYPTFHAYAAQLRAVGHEVVNPAETDHGSSTWTGCLRTDIRDMCACEAIALIPGWENSQGANLELHIAHRLGMEVMHLPIGFDLISHLRRQIDFSLRTFGPGTRLEGVTDHISKELKEVLESGGDLSEWVDLIILSLDGAWRSGATPEQIVQAIEAKQSKNERRKWPDWQTADPRKAIERDRSIDTPL